MIQRTALTFTFIWLTHLAFGQGYYNLVDKAYSAYKAKNYPKAAKLYSAAFKSLGGKGEDNDRYNAACCWALAGGPDSAFYQLEKLAAWGAFTNDRHFMTDSDLKRLYHQARWQPLLDTIRLIRERAEVNLNRPLATRLDSIYGEDQTLRGKIETVEKKYGADSRQSRALWKRIQRNDSANLLVVEAILNQYGWLGADVVGQQGNSALWLVIQHANLAAQEKHLPMMREAVAQGKASGSDLAYLVDRIAERKGKRQIYGSQLGKFPKSKHWFVFPLEDPDHVDERRAAVGLGPLAETVSSSGIKWNPAQYKKDLPALERKLKALEKSPKKN